MSVTHLNSNPVSSIATTDYILACDASGTLRCVSLGNLFRPAQGDGRNYLLQSVGSAQNCTVADGVVSLAGANADTFFFITPATDLAPLIGQWVTFSFECSGVLPGKAWEFSVENDNSAKCTLRNGRNVISFIGSSGNLIDSRGLLIDDLTRNVSPNIKLWNFKLEQGLVATDWTPAPEELRGGVIGYYTITCIPREKGGRPDGGREGFIERVSEVGDVGHNVVTVFHFGRECSLETWNLRHRRWLCESSIGYISIWNALCMQGRLLRVSGVFDISESPSYLPKAYRQRKQFHGLVSVNIADERRWAA